MKITESACEGPDGGARRSHCSPRHPGRSPLGLCQVAQTRCDGRGAVRCAEHVAVLGAGTAIACYTYICIACDGLWRRRIQHA